MKKILNAFALYLLFIIALSANIFAQTTAQKLTAEETKERAEVAAFVDSFMQEYYKTYDLTKVPESFFVSDYKKRSSYPFFVDKFDSLLTSDEKFQNGAMLVDLANLVFFVKLEEVDFDIEKAFSTDNDAASDDELIPKRMRKSFQNYPKTKIFLDEDFEQFQNVADFRASIKDFKSVLQESRDFLINASPDQKKKINKFLMDNRNKLFEFKDVFECSKDDCERFADKTKMFYYEAGITTLLIVNDKNQLKIIKAFPTTK